MNANPEIGSRFGRLLLVAKTSNTHWAYHCDCGGYVEKRHHDVSSGRIQSCGCLKREKTVLKNKASGKYGGGLARTPTMASWCGMISRCFNRNVPCYSRYGGAGITVCEFLRATPLNLVILIGLRPKGMTIDRKNNLAGYTCGKCPQCFKEGWAFNIQWATPTQQGRNQITNHIVTINGVGRCLSEWAEISRLGVACFRDRVISGWVGEKLLSPKRVFKPNPRSLEIQQP